jgi:hypothetical protein
VADCDCCFACQALHAALGGVRGDPTPVLQHLAAAAAAAALLLLQCCAAAAVVAGPCSSSSDNGHTETSDSKPSNNQSNTQMRHKTPF